MSKPTALPLTAGKVVFMLIILHLFNTVIVLVFDLNYKLIVKFWIILVHKSFSIYLILTINSSKNSLNGVYLSFLCAFAKFRKVTNSFVMSVSLSVDMQQLDFRWKDFLDFFCTGIYKNMLKKSHLVKISLK